MHRRMLVPATFAFLGVAFWLSPPAGAAAPKVEVGKRAPSFVLKDRADREFNLDRQRTQPLVLLFPTGEARGEMRTWRDSLEALRSRVGPFDAYIVVNPANMPGRGDRATMGRGDRQGLGMGANRPDGPPDGAPGRGRPEEWNGRRGPSVIHTLLDEGGTVTRNWMGSDPRQVVAVVLSTDNVVQAIIAGSATEDTCRQLAAIVRALRPRESGN